MILSTTPLTTDRACIIAASMASHARQCRKAPDTCATCTVSIDWFASLPLPLLSSVLADRPKTHSR